MANSIEPREVAAELVATGIYGNPDRNVIAKWIGEKYCGFTPVELDMVDIFWDSAFNQSWLYASNHMLVERVYGPQRHTYIICIDLDSRWFHGGS
jgi:hypothetical protein